MAKQFFVYMMASRARYGAIYTGSSGNITQRSGQHAGEIEGGAAWAKRYKACNLVWLELCDDYETMRAREVQLSKWRRMWKVELINKFNPEWRDLRPELPKLLGWI